MITATRHDCLELLRSLADEIRADWITTRVMESPSPHLEVEFSWTERTRHGRDDIRESVYLTPRTVTEDGFGSIIEIDSRCRLVDDGVLTFEEVVEAIGDVIDAAREGSHCDA